MRETMELVVQDISEAILMLGRQGVPNQGLLDQLELAPTILTRLGVPVPDTMAAGPFLRGNDPA